VTCHKLIINRLNSNKDGGGTQGITKHNLALGKTIKTLRRLCNEIIHKSKSLATLIKLLKDKFDEFESSTMALLFSVETKLVCVIPRRFWW